MVDLADEMQARVMALLGAKVTALRRVPRGYTAAERWRVALENGNSVFVKLGTTPYTSQALRQERGVYTQLKKPFMAELIGWEDHPNRPMLILEDLSAAHWPPPWTAQLVQQVQLSLLSVHASQAELPRVNAAHPHLGDGWKIVVEDPDPFIQLKLATSSWLERALPMLINTSAQLKTDGESVIHLDVRSDNLCQTPRGVVFVDWNHACLGNGTLDTGFWLPSLETEGGPIPEEVLPGRGDVAAYVSGYFAARAGLPTSTEAPYVRGLQLEQLKVALRWVARELGLPEPDGPASRACGMMAREGGA